MRAVGPSALFCVLTLSAGCGQPSPSKPAETPPQPPAPAVPSEFMAPARSVLGSEAEVLVYGDLARTGRQQALVINRLAKTPTGAVPGTLIMRAVLIESDGGKWKEILRCDEHLKNPNGFLGGTPIAPVTGWRLQYEETSDKGLVLYFTPLQQAGVTHIPTISVRWNPKVKRYQSLDRNYEHFLSELPALGAMNSYLR